MHLSEIHKRAAAIRLKGNGLAIAAKLSDQTVQRTLSGKTRPYQDTVDALAAGLVAEELKLLNYLLGLHPIGQIGGDKSRDITKGTAT